MAQMTTDRIYRDQKYYIKYDGAIRACKVVYYKASIDCDFENRYTHAVINIAGIGNVYFTVARSTTPTDLPTYVKKETVEYNTWMPKLYPNKECKINTELKLCLYSWHIRDVMVERNIMSAHHDYDSRYLMKCYTWNGYQAVRHILGATDFHGTYDYLTDSFEYCVNYKNKYYPTLEQCIADNKVSFVDFDKDDEDFSEQKREEFREYVAHHAPDFEDKIDWEYFMNEKSMPWNLSEQIKVWMS